MKTTQIGHGPEETRRMVLKIPGELQLILDLEVYAGGV
jgi:hypothetical protein